MKSTRNKVKKIFKNLDKQIEKMNLKRKKEKQRLVSKAEVSLLGQMSLLANEKASLVLSLAQTGDMDALLVMNYVVKKELQKILKKEGFIYDEDSPLIWIPKGAKFEILFDFKNVTVKSIDPESALVSKAIKAIDKNKALIRQAIASEKFPRLVDRILKNGGKLENFL